MHMPSLSWFQNLNFKLGALRLEKRMGLTFYTGTSCLNPAHTCEIRTSTSIRNLSNKVKDNGIPSVPRDRTSLVQTCEIRTSTSIRSLNNKGKDKRIPSVR